MTKFQRWVLTKIFSVLFKQGYNHHNNLAEVNSLIREVWKKEFYEDNEITTDAMLREAFESTQAVPTVMNNDVQQLINNLWRATNEI